MFQADRIILFIKVLSKFDFPTKFSTPSPFYVMQYIKFQGWIRFFQKGEEELPAKIEDIMAENLFCCLKGAQGEGLPLFGYAPDICLFLDQCDTNLNQSIRNQVSAVV